MSYRRLIRMLRTGKAREIRDNLDGPMTLTKIAFGAYDIREIRGGQRYSLGQVFTELKGGRVWWRVRYPDGALSTVWHKLRRDAIRVLTEKDKRENQ